MKASLALFMVLVATAASAVNHVGYVNVNNALDKKLFDEAVTNRILCSINVATKAYYADKLDIAQIIKETAKGYPKGECKMSVYFVDDKDYPPQVNAPGFFSVINVRGLKKDADMKKYAVRVEKMVLKGLAFACGFGANQDVGRCVMSAGSFETLKGIDSTSASYSPFCYFPLSDYLKERGLLLSLPVTDDDEE